MSDLSELFSRDPLLYDDKNLEEIITKFRASRHQFNAGNVKAGSTKPLSEKQKTALSLVDKLDL